MARQERTSKASTNPNLPMCGDGCGRNAAKGRSFLPGHDAKLASMLQQVADGAKAGEDLPVLVIKRLQGKLISLPVAKVEIHEIMVAVKVSVAKGSGRKAASEAVLARLALRTMTATMLATSLLGPTSAKTGEQEPAVA